jgi:hypothetical protein
LPANTRLERNLLTLANTLAYYDTGKVTDLKSFIVKAPEDKEMSMFHPIIEHHVLKTYAGKQLS